MSADDVLNKAYDFIVEFTRLILDGDKDKAQSLFDKLSDDMREAINNLELDEENNIINDESR